MSTAPKFYLLYIDEATVSPIKLWSVGELGSYISGNVDQALSSHRLELTTDSGELVLDRKAIRKMAYQEKFAKWQLAIFILFAALLIGDFQNIWAKIVGGICLLVTVISHYAPSLLFAFSAIGKRATNSKK